MGYNFDNAPECIDCGCYNVGAVSCQECINEKLIKQIKSELRFLNCPGVKWLVHEADLGTCHQDSLTIEKRKEKLENQLRNLKEVRK